MTRKKIKKNINKQKKKVNNTYTKVDLVEIEESVDSKKGINIQDKKKILTNDLLVSNLANDVLDKQYRLYSWADSKTSSLIQTNSILLATIGFIFKDCLIDILATIFVFLSIGANVISLFFCLKQVKPQKSSGKGVGETPNLRALSGILKFVSWQDYYTKLISINNDQIYEFSARQIYGMANNIEESRKNTTKAMNITLFGIAFLIISFISVSFSTNNLHPLGTWQTKESSKRDILKLNTTDLTKSKDTQSTKQDTIININK